MRTLFHYAHDPLARQVRLILHEKNLDMQDRALHPLDSLDEIAAMNPAGTLPILVDEPPTGGRVAICPVGTIIEYLEEAYPLPALFPATSAARAEARRLIHWFNEKFNSEVHPLLSDQYITKRLRRMGQPDPEKLRLGRDAIAWHLDYINFLTEERDWLGGDRFSVVDLVCAAHLSILDYIDTLPWKDFSRAHDWYARIKSRPSFRPLLADRVDGLPAARHYADLDF
ncbi:MAG: glutathione S-transferase family protein [Pseudomonadota bacterium]